MAYSALNEKKEELLDSYIADDDFLGDALCDCYAEIRALLNATSIDEKLAAIDSFNLAIKANIVSDERLEAEASEALSAYREQGDIEAFKARRAA